MAASGYATPSREEVLARDAWLDRRGDLSLDKIVSGMASGIKGLFSAAIEEQSERGARHCPPRRSRRSRSSPTRP